MASAGKRVLIIVQNLPVPFDRRVWLEATTLTRHGYKVSVICPKGKKGKDDAAYEYLEKIHIHRYPAPPDAEGGLGYIFEFAYCWLMTAMLSLHIKLARGFDVIHACNPPETFFALAWIYKLVGCKFIFDHHDLSPEMYAAKGGAKAGLLYKGLLVLEKLTFKTANVVITTNQSHKNIAKARGKVPDERIFIVRSGPDLSRLRPLPPEPALKNGLPYLVCYLGEMCPQDGVDYLLRAAKHIVQDQVRRDIQFVFIGGGPAMPEMLNLSVDMGLQKWVHFTGRVSDQDLCRYLSTADVCVDPDPYTEWSNQSTMNKIMEYMAFSKPIVAFDLKENHFSGQEAALYARPNEEREMAGLILKLLDDSEKRRAMGEYGRKRVETELSWEHSVVHLLKAYRQVQVK
jgi:glycosyltransferase involved in cell wall biosynthesis